MNSQTKAIAVGLNYIERHLFHPITVGDIANAAGYSLFHFIRTFNKIVRHTPYDYLIRRRLSQAAILLLETKTSVLDIALACQFTSHEGFTRGFGRLFDMSPTSWRDKGFPDQRYLIPPLSHKDLLFRQLQDFLPPKLIHRERKTLIGWMTMLTREKTNTANFRSLFKNTIAQRPIPGVNNDLWEVRTLPTSYDQPEMVFLGVTDVNEGAVSGSYVIRTVDDGDFLRFTLINLSEYREAAINYLYHTFLPKSGLRLAGSFEIEHLAEVGSLYLPVEKILFKA